MSPSSFFSSSEGGAPTSKGGSSFRRIVKAIAAIAAVLTFVNRGSGVDAAATTAASSSPKSHAASAKRLQKSNGVVTMELSSESRLRSVELPYIRCGPIYDGAPADADSDAVTGRRRLGGEGESAATAGKEVVLLHGSSFRKETWDDKTGILDRLCEADPVLSVTALDLDVAAQGDDLPQALRALQKAHLLSGNPVVIVTPSASGKAVVTLSLQDKRDYVQGWIPVAAGAVQPASSETLHEFEDIPILAIYGNRDHSWRYKSTERLVEDAHATSLELNGPHACYLESPHAFADAVLQFVHQVS